MRNGKNGRPGMHGQEAYRDTVNLPRTAFPMRAALPDQEPEILRHWERIDLYRCAQERTAGGTPFILHDGPPFSNGNIHLGHALNKILKDIIVKFRSMQGYDAPFVPGWDTHGLPTEIIAIRSFSLDRYAIDPLELRQRCAKTAHKYIDQQRKQFQRLGVRGDWDRPYLTMQPAYEAGVLETFATLVERGLVYRGLKPVYWCTSCETALAEAEIEYREHEAPSVYVAFPALRLPDRLFPEEDRTRMSAVIWTTTPWTLPANVAIAVHPDFTYALVRDEADEEGFTYLIALELLGSFATATAMAQPTVIAEAPGRELEGAVFLHPFLEREVPIVLADYVTLESGSGLVHIAPGHGKEDFITGISYGLPVIQPIGPEGIFGPEGGPFAGKPIYAAQEDILARLEEDGTLLAYDTILHQYPHCWRCRAPVIFRATEQWFLDVKRFTPETLAAIDGVRWLPEWGKERITGMVRERPDWCISRQRAWGIPIPAFYCEICHTPLLEASLIRQIAAVVREEGADAWYRRPVTDFLPEGTACAACGATRFRTETDIFDVWFDSGCSHQTVLAAREELAWPADLYVEGHDQYRGWFQVSLLTSVAAGLEQAPYRSVLTHGFILDQTGRKQSKSLGNIIDPQEVVKKYGADLLRLWVASADVRADLVMSEETFAQVIEVYRRIRNTLRYLLGNLYDYAPEMALSYDDLEDIDRWALHRLREVVARVTEAYARYEFHRVYQLVNEYCATELSSFYLDVLKDRLYTSLPDAPARRAAQTVFHHLAVMLTQLLAPVLSFTAEEVWQHLPEGGTVASVQLTAWPAPPAAWRDDALAARYARLLAVRDVVNTAVAVARRDGSIPQPLAAKISLYATGETLALLESFGKTLASLLLVSAVDVLPLDRTPAAAMRGPVPDLAVVVTRAAGQQCPRCRLWRVQGEHAQHPALCLSCAATVSQWPAGGRSAA